MLFFACVECVWSSVLASLHLLRGFSFVVLVPSSMPSLSVALPIPPPRPSNPPSSSLFLRLNISHSPSLFISFFSPTLPHSPSLSRCLSLSLSLSPSLFVSLLSFFAWYVNPFSRPSRWRSCAARTQEKKDPWRRCCNHFQMQITIRSC